MKLPKNPFQRKVETEGIENEETVEIGNVDEAEKDKKKKDDENDKNKKDDIVLLLQHLKPIIIALFFWFFGEFFKLPRVISAPICIAIIYFGYCVIIPDPNEVLVIVRLGVTREKLLERQMRTSVTSATSSNNPFRRIIILVPFIDKIVKRISLAHMEIDMPPYEAKTIGGTKVWLNSYVLIEVTNPSHFTFRIKNIENFIHESTKNQIIDLAANMPLEEIRQKIGLINQKLAQNISTFINTDYYGFNLVSLAIQSVKFPKDIEDDMAKKEHERLLGEAAKEKAEKELEIAKLQAKRKIEDAKGDADAMALRSIEEAKRQERLLQPFVNAGIADLYAKSLIFDNLPENATLFLGGEKGISPDAAYIARALKANQTLTPESNSTDN